MANEDILENARSLVLVSNDTRAPTPAPGGAPALVALAPNPSGSSDASLGPRTQRIPFTQYREVLAEAKRVAAAREAMTSRSPPSIFDSDYESESEAARNAPALASGERVPHNPDALRLAGALSSRDDDEEDGEVTSPQSAKRSPRMEEISNSLDEAQEERLEEQRYLTHATSPPAAARVSEGRNLREYFSTPLGTRMPSVPTPGPAASSDREVALRAKLRAEKLVLKRWRAAPYATRLRMQSRGERVAAIGHVPVIEDGESDDQALEDDFLYWCSKWEFPIEQLKASFSLVDIKFERALRFLYAKLKAQNRLNEPLVPVPPRTDPLLGSGLPKRKTVGGPKADSRVQSQKRARGPGSPPGEPTRVPTSSVSAGSPATSQGTDAYRVGGASELAPPPDNAFDPEGPAAPAVDAQGRPVTLAVLDRDFDRLFHRQKTLDQKIDDLLSRHREELAARDRKVEELLRLVASLQGQVSTLTSMVGPQRAPMFAEPVARPISDSYPRSYSQGYSQGYLQGFPQGYPQGYPPAQPQGYSYESYGQYDRYREPHGSYDDHRGRSRSRSDYRDQRGEPAREEYRYRSPSGWSSPDGQGDVPASSPLEPSARAVELPKEGSAPGPSAGSSEMDRGTA